ncbi:MAG: AsmA family protein [Rhodospirillales bacterium]
MMSFLIRIIKFAFKCAVVIAGIAVVISYARLSEFGDLRQNLLDKVMQSYAGRIQIDGKVELQATFPPTVSIENVRIKNAKWGTRPDMMTAERIVAEIDLLPLLAGDMAVPRLRMIGVDIVVEQKRDGTTNWDELNNFETASGPADPSTLPGVFPSIGGATVSVVGGTLTILNAALSAPTVLSLGAANIISPVVPCL